MCLWCCVRKGKPFVHRYLCLYAGVFRKWKNVQRLVLAREFSGFIESCVTGNFTSLHYNEYWFANQRVVSYLTEALICLVEKTIDPE